LDAAPHIPPASLDRSGIAYNRVQRRSPFFPARFDQRHAAEDTARFFTALSGLKTMRMIKTTSIDIESGEYI